MPIGIITTSHSGVDVVFEWKIDFFTLPEWGDKNYYSPLFSFGVERWFLVIYPNGSSERDSSGQVDLELCKRFSRRSIKQSFSLSLKTVKGEKYNEQYVTKDFDDIKCYHTINGVISRSDLTKRRSELVPVGVLTVVCTMKNTMSARNATGNDLEHAYVGVSTQRVIASTQRWRASIQRWRASTQRSGASTQRSGTSTQRSGTSTQRLGASTQCLGASTQRVGVSTQTVETSTQTVETSTQTVEEKYEATVSGSSTNSQEKKALLDFKELFLKKEDCDVTIKVKSSEFTAHRVILKARSPVLASTFRHGMKESATGVLEIDDCDPSSFSDFLCFLYCADMQLITQKSVFDLFTLADKYQVCGLRSKCLEFMKNNLTVDTFCETLTVALRHSETDLIKISTDYFKNNVPKIIVTVKWQTFFAENPIEGNELFVKYFVPNSS